MKPTQATDNRSRHDLTFEDSRNALITQIGDFSTLGQRPWDEVKNFELFPGVRLGDPLIEVPEEWMPSDPVQRPSFRSIDPTINGELLTGSPEAANARDESVRRAMLVLWLPKRTLTGIRQYKPTSWINRVKLLLRAVTWLIENKPSQNGSIWSHLELVDLLAVQEISENSQNRTALRSIFRWLADAGQRGLITDFPNVFLAEDDSDTSPEPKTEIGRRDDQVLKAPKKSKERNWQPFSAEFVSAIIGRALWMQEHLGQQLLDCWSGLRQITDSHQALGRGTKHPIVIAEREAFIQAIDWRDASGAAIGQLPFPITQKLDGKFAPSTAWPPSNVASINIAVSTLQMMNLAVISLCTGARSSELGDATDQAIETLASSRFTARTFKLRDEKTGKFRDWPLHPRAVQALKLQHDLAKRCRPTGSTHIWCMAHRGGSRLLNLTEPMVQAVESLGLSGLTGKDRAHMHRWRHTVAKLVALSVVGAPQVLLDLFGHRDLEMTLRYMLSDPEVAQEAMQVAKETSFALAVEAIEEAVADKASGLAIEPLNRGLSKLRMERGEEKYSAESLREAAEILTFNGRYWQLVRPGILCTKTLGQVGPCTQGRGEPDPGSCRTSCGHRLELQRAKKHCEESLVALLSERTNAESEEMEMLIANLDGQILSNLKRWPDVRDRILTSNHVARKIWEESFVTAF